MNNRQDKWFIVGADGLIGKALFNHLKKNEINVTGSVFIEQDAVPGTFFLDLAADAASWEIPEKTAVAVICAAVTSLEDCRKHPDTSRKINCTNTVGLARALTGRGVFVIFPSTNLVFDGCRALYNENDPVGPKTEYAKQKAETEKELLKLGPLVSVVRFSKIVWTEMPLIKGWMKALMNGEIIHPFLDLKLSPIPLSFAVEALVAIGLKRLPGITHVSGMEDISYSDVAYRIAELMNADKGLIQPVRACESNRPIEWLPANTTLSSKRFESESGMKVPDVRESLEGLLRS